MSPFPDRFAGLSASELAQVADARTRSLSVAQRRKLADYVASVSRERVGPLCRAEAERAREIEKQT